MQKKHFAMGWAAFSGLIMIMLGVWWLVAGIAAMSSDGSLFVSTPEWALQINAPTWGFIHILLGTFLLAAGFGVFQGKEWARMVGTFLAMVGGIVAFIWLPYFPIWALLYIAMSVAVVWALTVHGEDLAGT